MKLNIKEGIKFEYEGANFSSIDNYIITIKSIEPDLQFDYYCFEPQDSDEDDIISEESELETEQVLIKNSALNKSHTLIPFEQGHFCPLNKETEGLDCPIFVLSRKQYSELINEKETRIRFSQSNNYEAYPILTIKVLETLEIPVKVNNEEVLVEAIHGLIKGSQDFQEDNIWILNEPSFPLVLNVETDFTAGDTYWKIISIKTI